MTYPVTVAIQPLITGRNRMTTAFRALLAIPHVFLVGGAGVGLAYSTDRQTSVGAESGLIGVVAAVLAVVSWCTILVSGTHIAGIRHFTSFYMRWRLRALAYLMLLEDAYPPFGDGTYPTSLDVTDPTEPRRRLSVAFRGVLAIPHLLTLAVLVCAWCLTTVVAWFSILITGRYPAMFYGFGVGVLRWRLRVDAYLLLLVDDYPPFSLD